MVCLCCSERSIRKRCGCNQPSSHRGTQDREPRSKPRTVCTGNPGDRCRHSSGALRFEVDDVVCENMRNPRGSTSAHYDHRRGLLHELPQHAAFSLIRITVDEPNRDRCTCGIAVDCNGASIAPRRECCREILGIRPGDHDAG